MTTVTLLEKTYGSFSTQTFETILRSLCKGLRLKVKVQDKTVQNWIQIELSGEDESVALRLLDKEIGLAPGSADKVSRFSTLRGKVVGSDEAARELRVDIGVFEPIVCDAYVLLQRLQAQLADGKKLPLNHLIELFCLRDYAPLQVKILDDSKADKNLWEAELSETQLSQFSNWLASSLDRLLVFGASRREVEEAIRKAKHFRDVIKIEPLGPFEHAALCKLGTDAVGLMPKLGPHLRLASLCAFSPRRIRNELKC